MIRRKPLVSLVRRIRRESLIVLGFFVLTAVMTWPWVANLRGAVRDEGDPYAHTYFLWWGNHQTFHDPLHLFDATIFYPYKNTFAFGENDYGISLIFFPLFALGLRPLTVHSIATFLSFPFTGYGMFRLARTLSHSHAVAWVAGIVLAFIPYRFHQLSHLPLIFAGWIPLLFEALVLFARERSWKRAAWLGLAFVMNALTCLTWFVLTLIPLGISAILLLTRNRAWRDRGFWLHGATTLAATALVLLPFLLPFRQVARQHGFVRSSGEVQAYSARPINWVAAEPMNKLWAGLGSSGAANELVLFPGLLPILLALIGLLLALAVADRSSASDASLSEKSPIRRIYAGVDFELVSHGLVWSALGFMGSFGLNFVLYRILFEYLPIFRSMRVAARWAMICYFGLALLAGLGAGRLAPLLSRHWPWPRPALACAVLILAILFEQRVAPMVLPPSQPDPDELTLYLKAKEMAGGIVELPAGEPNQYYMLRAADHGHPLVTAIDSFTPPIEQEIEVLTKTEHIPDRLLDLLETIPASYVTVHNSFMTPETRQALEVFLDNGMKEGRLRFIKSFAGHVRNGLPQRNDLYAVVKTEPQARSEGAVPPRLSVQSFEPLFTGLLVDFRQMGYFVYRLYKASYGRAPHFAEFMADLQVLKERHADGAGELEAGKRAFIENWMRRPQFRIRYEAMDDGQFVDALLTETGITSRDAGREKLVIELGAHTMTRAAVLESLIDNPAFPMREFNRAFVMMHYFAYLKRDPDEAGFQFWLQNLNRFSDYSGFTEAFAASTERQRN